MADRSADGCCDRDAMTSKGAIGRPGLLPPSSERASGETDPERLQKPR